MNIISTEWQIIWPLIIDTTVGIVILLLILFFHGGTINHAAMRFEQHAKRNMASKKYSWVFVNFYIAFNSIALIHISEVVIWGICIHLLGLMADPIQALIFAGSCYTTVGFAADTLPAGWKSLAFFIAFTGLFSLAWTTSLMMNMTAIYREAWRHKYEEVHHNKNQKTPT